RAGGRARVRGGHGRVAAGAAGGRGARGGVPGGGGGGGLGRVLRGVAGGGGAAGGGGVHRAAVAERAGGEVGEVLREPRHAAERGDDPLDRGRALVGEGGEHRLPGRGRVLRADRPGEAAVGIGDLDLEHAELP